MVLIPRAIITHAHPDHFVAGCGAYLVPEPGVGLLREQVGAEAFIQAQPYGEPIVINGVEVVLVPSGHVLGGAQIRIDASGIVWNIAGEFKLASDPTCDAFEPVECDVLVMEATFGSPSFHFPEQEQAVDLMRGFVEKCFGLQQTPVFLAYSLVGLGAFYALLRGGFAEGRADPLLAFPLVLFGDAPLMGGPPGRWLVLYRSEGRPFGRPEREQLQGAWPPPAPAGAARRDAADATHNPAAGIAARAWSP